MLTPPYPIMKAWGKSPCIGSLLTRLSGLDYGGYRFDWFLWIPLTLIGAIGIVPLFQASSFGGRLVYEYGVGVEMVDSMSVELEQIQRQLVEMGIREEFILLDDDRGWQWRVGEKCTNDIRFHLQGDHRRYSTRYNGSFERKFRIGLDHRKFPCYDYHWESGFEY